MKKKILFIIDSLNSGGAERSLISLLSVLDYKRFSVELLLFSENGLFLPLIPSNVKIITIKEEKSSFSIKKLYKRIKISLMLRNPYIMRSYHSAQIIWSNLKEDLPTLQTNYDIAIAYSQGFPTYFAIKNVNAKRKICWVNTDYKMAAYNKSFDEEYYNMYERIVTVSDANKKIFENEFPQFRKKTKLIYDINSPQLIESLSLSINEFPDNFTGTKILTIGRLVEAKGYDLALEACQILKKQGVNFRWYAIGEGPLKCKLERSIKQKGLKDYFVLLGTFSNPYPLLKQCDLYVQPSKYEGYGLAIAEARILKKPIVTTDFSTAHNQIRHRENGLIVKMTPESVVEGINEILSNSDLIRKITSSHDVNNLGTENEINKFYSIIH
ncbi:glycosyltransferase [Sutcliffiella horikoshii]|uniref:glycosyltransferase n=1 Tax=Sutcliffiella horikoshii TaxID=79883 RepID=UPI001CC16D2C|nr:glycosyltransferase [Sutcliffiella horikoshii]UAL46933.1 glycosyltransferase [Sutcliffiella horikoshii]